MPRAAPARDTPAGSRDIGLPYPAEDLSEDDDLFSFLLVDQLGMRAQTKLGVHPQQVKFIGPAHNREDVLNILRDVSVARLVNNNNGICEALSLYVTSLCSSMQLTILADRATRNGPQYRGATSSRVSSLWHGAIDTRLTLRPGCL